MREVLEEHPTTARDPGPEGRDAPLRASPFS
jgi:hypothetical protein